MRLVLSANGSICKSLRMEGLLKQDHEKLENKCASGITQRSQTQSGMLFFRHTISCMLFVLFVGSLSSVHTTPVSQGISEPELAHDIYVSFLNGRSETTPVVTLAG